MLTVRRDSFVDNFEWQSGFAVRFGMQYCNFSDPELPRPVPKAAILGVSATTDMKDRYYKASFFELKSAFDIYQEK